MISEINGLYHLKQTNQSKALQATCKEFESMFAYQLLKVMGEATPEGLFEQGLASDMYKDMLFQSVGQAVAESGALGIGTVLNENLQARILGDENLSVKMQNR